MFKLFKPKYRSILGIDISSTSVKVLEISGAGENHIVEGYGKELLPLGAVDGHLIKDPEAVAECIKQVVSRSGLKSKFASLAVPDSAVISKVVQISDGLTDSEIEELVIIEADKYIPYPIDEINLDFEVLGHSPKNAAMLDIMIVASRAENVTSRIEAITKAGLEAKVMDVESFAIERVIQALANDLPANGQGKIIAVIDIGTLFTHLFVLHGLKIIFTREEEFGGKQLIDAISAQYNVGYREALLMKDQEQLPADYDQDVLQPFIETILLQIKRTLQFFFSTSQHMAVDHILLAGGVARLPKLAKLIQEKTKIPTSIANPFTRMTIAENISSELINQDAPSLLVACGLALRNIE